MAEKSLVYSFILDFIVLCICVISCDFLFRFGVYNILENPTYFNWLCFMFMFALSLLGSNTIYSILSNILIAFFGKNNLAPQEKKL